MSETTLQQLRDRLREVERNPHGGGIIWPGEAGEMADAIDAHLSQPQPVARVDAVAYVNPDELAALVRDAKKFGKTQYCIDAFAKPAGMNTAPLYATPTLPTGHMVVPVEQAGKVMDAQTALTILGQRISEAAPSLPRPSWISTHKSEFWTAGIESALSRVHAEIEVLDHELRAAPDAGGV